MDLETLRITERVLECSVVEQMKCPRNWERPPKMDLFEEQLVSILTPDASQGVSHRRIDYDTQKARWCVVG